MKKDRESSSRHDADLLEEYDFSQGARGKYAKRYAAGTNVVVLLPDVAKSFPDSRSVNEALRALIKAARSSKSDVAKGASRGTSRSVSAMATRAMAQVLRQLHERLVAR